MDIENIATINDYEKFIDQYGNSAGDYAFEWSIAVKAGWKKREFDKLYNSYVISCKKGILEKQSAAKIKGDPLEDLARYYLQMGGIVHDISEINEKGVWQIDGQGTKNTTAILLCWGEELCAKIGAQLFMEAKNHKEPMKTEDFSHYYSKMTEHGCQTGVVFSTSGYSVGHGKGIAPKIYYHYLRGYIHILMSFSSIYNTAVNDIPPLIVLRLAITYATNNSYVNDREIQFEYSKKYCHLLINNEFDRINKIVYKKIV